MHLAVAACLLGLAAVGKCQVDIPTEGSFTAKSPAFAPSPYQSGNAQEVYALDALKSHLKSIAAQEFLYGWFLPSRLACGSDTCNVTQCTWKGIACAGWRVVGIDVSRQVIKTPGFSNSDSLPPELGNLTTLAFLNFSGQSIGGSLPAEWGALSSLQLLDVSRNQLTGVLPTAWSGMSSLRSLNVSSNKLSGSVPQMWANISNLTVLDLNNNNICRSMILPSSPTILNNNAPCANTKAFDTNGTLLPSSSTPRPPPPPPTASPPPPSNSNLYNSSPVQPSLQMSTGINIAVSVVIGAFLLFGIVAGAVRVKRQQNAHAEWLRARAETIRMAHEEEAAAFRRHLETLQMPNLVVDPSSKTISVAVPDKPQGPTNPGTPPGSDSGGSPSPAVASTSSPEPQTREGAVDEAERDRADGASGQQEVRVVEERPSASTSRVRSSRRERMRSERSRRARGHRPAILVIDAFLLPGGRLTFDPAESPWSGDAADPTEAAAGTEQRPVVQMPPETTPGTGGVKGMWNTLRGAKRQSSLDLEAGRVPSAAGRQADEPARVRSSAMLRASSGALPSGGSLTAGQDPSVAARVRERIDELREPAEAPAAGAVEGPAPPGPLVWWSPLRRILGLETVEDRNARLRQEATQVAREHSEMPPRQ